MKKQQNPALGIFTLFLIIGGIVLAFPLDQLWIGIGLFSIAMIIILIKITWGISVWADDTLHRWTDENLAPKKGDVEFDITFDPEKEEKNETK